MITIVIPDRFSKKLIADSENLQGDFLSIKRNFSQIYQENNMYFFNEYTDHGIRHINRVLKAIDNLITEDSWKLLSSKDVFIIILSVFLHDLGMHIQPITFKAMINGEYDHVPNYGFADRRWSTLWTQYLVEAKKWNEEELRDLLGEETLTDADFNFEEVTNLNENAKKLIGEFIRRHHTRIAFEVAFKGLKTHTDTFVDLAPNLQSDLRFLSGLVARSHGMNVRDTYKILEQNYSYGWKSPDNTHAFYIMILLRLADYFQVDESRILIVPFQTKFFKSPVSKFEHAKHFSINEPHPLVDDPETLFFKTSPKNGILFNAIKILFDAIQTEIDISWAILGEIYTHTRYKPKIKYRRIQSNIDDSNYKDNLTFVPELISFSADKELLKLLIAPLYGFDPNIGIRELLQNAIDACFEREVMVKSNDPKYDPAIEIKFNMDDDKRTFFSISDNGKGMTIDEIRNYFLRAGSSLKKSKEWKKLFVQENKTLAIHRIGKFGIGVLAAYLLGNEIEVETKSVDSEYGYKFKTKIDDSNIEVFKTTHTTIGTSITIYVSDDVRDILFREVRDRWGVKAPKTSNRSYRWDKWYVFSKPQIRINIYNFPPFSPHSNYFPLFTAELDEDWREFSTNDFEKIQWTYDKKYPQSLFACNGIVIPNANYSFHPEVGAFKLRTPTVSVFDFKGNLNVELNRNSLVNNHPSFLDQLQASIYRDIVKSILFLEVPVIDGRLTVGRKRKFDFIYEGLGSNFNIAYSEDGFVVNIPFFQEHLRDKQIFGLEFHDIKTADTNIDVNLTSEFVFVANFSPPISVSDLQGNSEIQMFNPETSSDATSSPFDFHNNIPYLRKEKLVIPSVPVSAIEATAQGGNKKTKKSISRNFVPVSEDYKFNLNIYRLPHMRIAIEEEKAFVLFLDKFGIQDTLIPYEIGDRRRKFAVLFDELNL